MVYPAKMDIQMMSTRLMKSLRLNPVILIPEMRIAMMMRMKQNRNDESPNQRLMSRSENQAPMFPAGLLATTSGLVTISRTPLSIRLWSMPPVKKNPIIEKNR